MIGKYLLFVFVFVFASCANMSMKSLVYHPEYHHEYRLMSEGWWVLLTDNQSEVAEMCGDRNSHLIVGCARWPQRVPDTYPVKDCMIAVFTEHPLHPVETIIAHERRHCMEGAWHPE